MTQWISVLVHTHEDPSSDLSTHMRNSWALLHRHRNPSRDKRLTVSLTPGPVRRPDSEK